MALLLVVLALEIRPTVGLIRWRLRAGDDVDTTPARRMAAISYLQAVLVTLMVLAATAMARGMDL